MRALRGHAGGQTGLLLARRRWGRRLCFSRGGARPRSWFGRRRNGLPSRLRRARGRLGGGRRRLVRDQLVAELTAGWRLTELARRVLSQSRRRHRRSTDYKGAGPHRATKNSKPAHLLPTLVGHTSPVAIVQCGRAPPSARQGARRRLRRYVPGGWRQCVTSGPWPASPSPFPAGRSRRSCRP